MRALPAIALGLATVLATATPVEARFAPATGATYRLAITGTRDDGTTLRRTDASYDVDFARDGGGYRATLTPRDAGDPIRAALRDLPITVRLDRAGRLAGMENAAAAWTALRSAIAAQVPPPMRAMALARHDAASADERAAILAGDLLDLIDGGDPRGGTRTTTLPVAGGAPLPARETIRREGSTTLVTLDAEGPIAGGTAAIARRRRVDRRTGLVREAFETRRIAATPDGTLRIEKAASLRLMVR